MTHFRSSKERKDRPLVIAHRGASGYLPEHTLIGASMAYALGADFLEPDLVLTKDSVPVVLHDIQLDDTTDVAKKFPKRKRKDGRYYAIDFTLEEIKTLRVNERIDLSKGERVFSKRFPLGLSKFEVPTFAELIELLIGLNQSTGKNVGIYPELKEPQFHLKEGLDIAKISHKLVESYKSQLSDAPFYWQCFHADTLKRFEKELPTQYPRILLIEDNDLDLKNSKKLESQIADIAKFCEGIGPSLTHVFKDDGTSTGLVQLAHKYKLQVHAYTVRADQLPKFAPTLDDYLKKIFEDEGIDAVFTDFTDRVVSYLNLRSIVSLGMTTD